MQPLLRTSIVGFALVTAFAYPASAQQTRSRTVYVSVLDKDGAPVTGLEASEFEVKAGGKTQTIVSVKEAAAPLRIAILDADQGTGAYQAGIARFMQTLLGRAEFSLTSVIIQADKVTDYSPDGRVLSEGLSKLGRRGRQAGAQLLDAINEAAKTVNAEGKRPVILVTRLGGEGPATIQGKDVMEQLRKSRAILYVVSSAGADGRAPSLVNSNDSVAVQQGQALRDSEMSETSQQLSIVLGDGSKESGGRHDQVVGTSHAQTVQRVANELLHQYEVTYEGPDTLKAGDKLAVSSKRRGVTVRAPSRLPN
jgi:VWFA-related protein